MLTNSGALSRFLTSRKKLITTYLHKRRTQQLPLWKVL